MNGNSVHVCDKKNYINVFAAVSHNILKAHLQTCIVPYHAHAPRHTGSDRCSARRMRAAVHSEHTTLKLLQRSVHWLFPSVVYSYPSEAYPVPPSRSLSQTPPTPPANPLWSSPYSTDGTPTKSHNPIGTHGWLTSRVAESTVHKRKSRMRDSVRLTCVT